LVFLNAAMHLYVLDEQTGELRSQVTCHVSECDPSLGIVLDKGWAYFGLADGSLCGWRYSQDLRKPRPAPVPRLDRG
jgi:hypothetical protein